MAAIPRVFSVGCKPTVTWQGNNVLTKAAWLVALPSGFVEPPTMT